MKAILWIFCLCLLVNAGASAETLYRWVDKEGKVHYGDRPAEDAVKTEKRKIYGASAGADEENLPYAVRKAKQDFPVTLFTTGNCGEYCTQARSLLNKRGVPFDETTLQYKEEFEAFKNKYGNPGLPALLVGKTMMHGFLEGRWNNELDLAGYPKQAAYGFKPRQAPPVKTEEAPATAAQPDPAAAPAQ